MILHSWWLRAWHLLSLGPPGHDVWDDLNRRYAEPHRAYHTLFHLEECFARFEEAEPLAERPGEVLVALWYHDAVYDTHAADNEARSAELAIGALGPTGADEATRHRVVDLILATRHDKAPHTGDAALIADIDLAILGASESRFEEYEAQIRREYSWVPEPLFRETRARLLSAWLDRPAIYATEQFRKRFEAPARRNLRRSVSRLNDSTT